MFSSTWLTSGRPPPKALKPVRKRKLVDEVRAARMTAARLRYILVEARIGHRLPQLAVLILQLLETPHLGRQQAIVLLLPVEVRRMADAGLTTNICYQMPSAPCLRMNAFWASENLEAFIALRSSQPRNHSGKLYPKTVQDSGLRAARRRDPAICMMCQQGSRLINRRNIPLLRAPPQV
jgi:hypothetical protein